MCSEIHYTSTTKTYLCTCFYKEEYNISVHVLLLTGVTNIIDNEVDFSLLQCIHSSATVGLQEAEKEIYKITYEIFKLNML